MGEIHPTAVVDPAARLGTDVVVGPYCVVGPGVTLGDRVELRSHVVVDGLTEIGDGTRVFPFAAIGLPPQDLKYKGEESRLVVGKNNVIREQVTMHCGTEGGGMVTRVGDGGLFMIGVHIAHDCVIGDHVIMANNATLAGHVQVGDYAVIGGLAAAHQFVRIGSHAMIGGLSGVEQDVIPYGSVMGERAHLSGLNIVGMKRRGIGRETIHSLRAAYKDLFGGEGVLDDRVEAIDKAYGNNSVVREVIDFIRGDSPRGLTRPKPENGG